MREEITQQFVDTGILDPAVIHMVPSPGLFRVVPINREWNSATVEMGPEFFHLEHAKAAAERLLLEEDPPLCALVINDMGETMYDTSEAVQ